MVSIELQQLQEVKSVISLPHISNRTPTTNSGLPQKHPIAVCI